MKGILVTGATGFLGGHVLDALRVRFADAPLRVLVRSRTGWRRCAAAARHPDVVALEGELADAAALAEHPKLAELEGIVHLAALVRHSRADAHEVYAANVGGTRAVMALAAKMRARVVFVSTSGTVGCSLTPTDAPDETGAYAQDVVGSWPYYDSKIAAEQTARALAREHGVTLSVLRPPAMLGPGDARGRATSLVHKFVGRKLPFVLAGGTHIADVRDVAMAVSQALAHPQPREIYHLPGHAETLTSFFSRLERLSHVPAPRRILPYALAHSVARLTCDGGRAVFGRALPPRLDPVLIEMGRCFWGLSSKHTTELGYASRPVDTTLRDTLRELSREPAQP